MDLWDFIMIEHADYGKRKAAIEHMQENMSMCRSLIERCPFPMIATQGEAHTLVYVNPMFCRLCSKPEETLIGHSVVEAMPECAEDGSLSLLDRVYRSGESETVMDLAHYDPVRGIVYRAYAAWTVQDETGRDEAERPLGLMIQVVDTTTVEIREINRALVIASVQQHEIAEEAIAARAYIEERDEQQRHAAVLEERNRIAREIHDTLAQAFTGILIQLRVAQRIAHQQPEEAAEIIEHVRELAQLGLAEARRSVWALQSEAQEYRDLAGALSGVIERMSSETDAKMELYVNGSPRVLPPDIGMNLLRIGQEALTNALRHGQARTVRIELTFDDERVLLRVQDDGLGIDLKHHTDGGGFGMIGMGQRAEHLGGQLTIASQPGLGTEVAVSIPLEATQDREERA